MKGKAKKNVRDSQIQGLSKDGTLMKVFQNIISVSYFICDRDFP
jgi:hypothetical protein